MPYQIQTKISVVPRNTKSLWTNTYTCTRKTSASDYIHKFSSSI